MHYRVIGTHADKRVMLISNTGNIREAQINILATIYRALSTSRLSSSCTSCLQAAVHPRVTKFFSKDFRDDLIIRCIVFFRYSAGYDLAARRKNATRESTATLKAWLNEHKKNPYPTKGEKIMLAIITKMTLTQVSTWFANARRRLKKENKMTWEPKNKTDDDDDAVLSDSEDNKEKDDLAADNRSDRVGEEARRGLDDTGKFFSPLYYARIWYHRVSIQIW